MNSSQDGLKPWERLGLHCVGGLLVTLTALLLYGVVLRPSATARAENLSEMHRLRATIASRQATTDAYTIVRDRQTELEDSIENVRTRLTTEPDLNRLLRQLSSLAEKHDAQVLMIQPTQRRDGDRAACQHVHIRMSASYESLCRILQDTTQMDCLVWINGAKISSHRSTNEIQPFELELALLFAPEGTEANQIVAQPDNTAGDV